MHKDRRADFTVLKMSCPIAVMHFHLVYGGPLPSAGNRPKPEDARNIRDQFHPQLQQLWQTSDVLKRLRWTARVPENPGAFLSTGDSPLFEWDQEPPTDLPRGHVDLCEPLKRGDKTFYPLVRKSLSLNCSLAITFLRQEDPGELVLQGGDIDGRLKTLFDALRVPDIEVEKKYPQAQASTYCLLESDTLISGFDVETGRLLFPKTTHAHEVHLVIEVTVRVLKLGPWNLCLIGG